jgi:hypothetical protein
MGLSLVPSPEERESVAEVVQTPEQYADMIMRECDGENLEVSFADLISALMEATDDVQIIRETISIMSERREAILTAIENSTPTTGAYVGALGKMASVTRRRLSNRPSDYNRQLGPHIEEDGGVA